MKTFSLLFCLFLLAFPKDSFAQNFQPETAVAPGLYRNSVYLEIGGNAGGLSLNYERLVPFANINNYLALRVGGIFVPYGRVGRNLGYEFYLPLEASVLLGRRAVKLELGLGTTIGGYGGTRLNIWGQTEHYNQMEAVSVLRIGGRWQKPGKHWFVRVGFTPFLQEMYTVIEYPFSPWAGISVGYNFGK